MFVVAEKKSPHGLVIVITDKEIMGKIFSEGKLQLDLTKQFYNGEGMNTEEVKKVLEKAYIVHFTGEKAIALGKKCGLIESNEILTVKNIPHAEVILC